ncbi:MAG: MBL fold metallo-hydrolase [Pseudomonadota bacterium]
MRDPFRRTIGVIAAIALGLALWGADAVAEDQVVVQRNVSVREAPDRQTPVVTFPAIGQVLDLLDAGARTGGYYHVILPDGRTGWVYFSFVRRLPETAGGPATSLVAGDRVAVHYIDVDQGAAALLEFPCGAVMIDVGGRGEAASAHLAAYLDAFFARRTDLHGRLDAIFITHTHVDHNSNLKAVVQAPGRTVGSYIHNGVMTGSGRANARWLAGFPPRTPAYAAAAAPPIQVREVSEDEVAAAGGQGLSDAVIDPLACPRVDPRIRVLSGRYDDSPGWSDGELDNGNNQSLVIRVDYGAASFLFTGDLEEPAIETLVSRYAGGGVLDVDVWEVGHHGSANGVTESLLRAMSPQIAVISMGRPSVHEKWTAWAYGHPRRGSVTLVDRYVSDKRRGPPRVLVADKVKQFSAYAPAHAVYATGWDGDVTVSAGPDGALRVELGK